MKAWRKRIGFILPANNPFMEPELYRAVPKDVSLHFTRVALRKARDLPASVPVGDETVDLLVATGVDVVVYACMSGSLADVQGWSDTTSQRIGIPVITAADAMVSATRSFAKSRIALVSHYDRDRMSSLANWFGSLGFEVVSIKTAGFSDPGSVRHIEYDDVVRLVHLADRPEAELICLVGTDLPTFSVLETLERETGKPVISSNQAILWKALQLAGIRHDIAGFGLLLRAV